MLVFILVQATIGSTCIYVSGGGRGWILGAVFGIIFLIALVAELGR